MTVSSSCTVEGDAFWAGIGRVRFDASTVRLHSCAMLTRVSYQPQG